MTANRPEALPDPNLTTTAWAITLLASNLPDIFWSLAGDRPAWLWTGKLVLLLAALVLSWIGPAWRPLRTYIFAITAVFLALRLQAALLVTGAFHAWLQGGVSWAWGQIAFQGIRVAIALTVAALVLGLGHTREQLFLVRGQMDAMASPVPWLGQKNTVPWREFARVLVPIACVATLAFMALARMPSLAQLARALPWVPAALLMAALNALDENILMRAVLLGPLEPAVGSEQAILMAAVHFGLAHYGSTFGGLAGVAMAAFLGWLMGKAIVETRGLAWAWLIQFPQDAIIFLFYALSA